MTKPAMPSPSEREAAIFAQALEKSVDSRPAFLDRECAGDAALRQRVEALLAAHEQPATALDDDARGPLATMEIKFPKGPGGTAITPLTEKAGDIIGRYKLLQQIGEGGCGVVYMAEQSVPVRRRVALKVIKLGMDTKQVVARFEAERQALALMDHPNIARVLDAGATDTGRPFFVMELVRGTKITEFADQQKLSTVERLDLFIQVCSAIQHAHQKGIIHRDIKPSNVLVTLHDGVPVPKVIDFGIAKATNNQQLTDKTLFTAFEQFIGTPAYMSPEQAEMSGLDIDTRSDIYSLGVLLYELLTGRTPFDSTELLRSGLDGIRKTLREQEPPKPSTCLNTLAEADLTTVAKARHADAPKLLHSVRGDLDWVVMKCLEKDRARRYDTANGLAADLKRHLGNEPVVARPPSTTYRLQKAFRRNKVAFTAGTAIAASLVIGIAVSVWQAVRAKSAEHRAVAVLDELRASAPAFAEQARGLAAKEQYADAIAKLDYAIKLRPDMAEFLVAKGDLLQCQFKLAEAATIYRAALALQPDHARAGDSAKLCDELLAAPPGPDGKLTRESLGKLRLAMLKQQRPAAELLPVARLLDAEKEHLVAYWLERLKDLPISPEKPLKDRLTVLDDGRLELDLRQTLITDLAALAGMPLGNLTLENCRLLADFAPLREFRSLTYLNLDYTQITDLSVLRGLPLEMLFINGTKVSDLSPLRGMKLKRLVLGCPRVSDLSPLEGMPLKLFVAMDLANGTDFSPLKDLPLEKCMIIQGAITDLSFLAACPLKELGLYITSPLRRLGWLNDIKTLERLVLPSNFRNFSDDDLQAIAALRNHPRLAFIQADSASRNDSHSSWHLLQVSQPKDIFWQDWDREQAFLPAIRATEFDFTLQKRPDDTYYLRLESQPLRDLSIIKGAPISALWIGATKVTNLAPIAELPLRSLGIWSTEVTDISPLRGMRLEELSLGTGAVADLSPLAGMPLQKLYMHQCKAVGDLGPILGLQTLQSLTVPVTARNIESLRSLKNLKWLGYRGDSRDQANSTRAELFWERWPGMAWSQALNESGMDYTASEDAKGIWSVTVKSKEFRDCGVFKGAAIKALTLNDTSVADLRPLEGLALTKLNLQKTDVTDLAPLRGMPLKELNIHGTRVTDLTALRGMKLHSLILGSTPITNLSPLHGMPLTKLHMSGTEVADISALRGMLLTELRMPWCPLITDLTPLAEARSLESITLPPNATEIEFLRHRKTIRRISYTENFKENTKISQPDKTADRFWKEYDEAGWRTALRKAGIVPSVLRQLADGTWEVDLEKSGITNLNILGGAAISILRLGNTEVSDLTTLRGMPLKHLVLYNTKVTDLRPLEGMRLEYLSVSGTAVEDISVLRGMPLRRVRLHGCKNLTDLSPLTDCTELTDLTLPPNAKNFEFLRDPARLPKLTHLSFAEDMPKSGPRMPDKTRDEFWKDYNAKKRAESMQP